MAITVGVYLGKKDRFLRNWYDILPRGQFPLLVKYCIQSYLKGVYFPLDTICESDSFRERLTSMQELSPTQRNVTFTEEDGPVFRWVKEVDNGYRSEEIKSILKDTIVHTMLEEHERSPLARQRYSRLWNGKESGPVYEPVKRMKYHWQEGTGSHPDRREGWASAAVRETPGLYPAAESQQQGLYSWREERGSDWEEEREQVLKEKSQRAGGLG